MTRLINLGHASLLIEIGGLRLLTDPILRSRIGHLRRFRGAKLPRRWGKIDAVLISHLHWDHLDIPSLRLLGRTTHLIVPRGAAGFLRRRGFTTITEVAPGDTVRLDPVAIEVTPAAHRGGRPLWGPAVPSVGFLLRHDQTIYFAGDTDLFPEMARLATDLDLALLPVWGWGPTLGPGHLTPRRAAEALTLLRPRLAIPIHWGTFHPLGMGWLRPDFLFSPPVEFAAHAGQMTPDVHVEIVLPGHPFTWSPSLPSTEGQP